MADYHFVYKDGEGASTQWDDIHGKLGNLPEKLPVFKPPAFTLAADEDSMPKDKSWIDSKTEDELEDSGVVVAAAVVELAEFDSFESSKRSDSYLENSQKFPYPSDSTAGSIIAAPFTSLEPLDSCLIWTFIPVISSLRSLIVRSCCSCCLNICSCTFF